jgi:hypothetical protein
MQAWETSLDIVRRKPLQNAICLGAALLITFRGENVAVTHG